MDRDKKLKKNKKVKYINTKNKKNSYPIITEKPHHSIIQKSKSPLIPMKEIPKVTNNTITRNKTLHVSKHQHCGHDSSDSDSSSSSSSSSGSECPKNSCKCGGVNTDTAIRLVNDLASRNFQDFINSVSPNTIIRINASRGNIPYGGQYTGQEGAATFLNNFNSSVTINNASICGEVACSCSGTIIIKQDVNTTLMCTSGRCPIRNTQMDCTFFIWCFVFSSTGAIVSIDLTWDTSVAAIFFSNCLLFNR